MHLHEAELRGENTKLRIKLRHSAATGRVTVSVSTTMLTEEIETDTKLLAAFIQQLKNAEADFAESGQIHLPKAKGSTWTIWYPWRRGRKP